MRKYWRGGKIYPEWHLLELLVEEGQIAGALVYDLARAKLEIIRCKVVILATGGYGRAFAKRPTPMPTRGTEWQLPTGQAPFFQTWNLSNFTLQRFSEPIS